MEMLGLLSVTGRGLRGEKDEHGMGVERSGRSDDGQEGSCRHTQAHGMGQCDLTYFDRAVHRVQSLLRQLFQGT